MFLITKQASLECSHGYGGFQENEEEHRASECLSSEMAQCHCCHIILVKIMHKASLGLRDGKYTP